MLDTGITFDVKLPDGREVRARPAAFRVKATDHLDVVIHEPPGGFTSASIGSYIELGIKLWGLLKGDGGGGGGGGGGKQSCTQEISSTTSPDGTITTTIKTSCKPA